MPAASKFLFFFFSVSIFIIILFSVATQARIVHLPGAEAMEKISSDPEHVGFRCLSRRYRMPAVRRAVDLVCPQNKNGTKSTIKTYPATKHYRLPKDARMVRVDEEFSEEKFFDYVIFVPKGCKVVGLVHRKNDQKHWRFKLCERTS
ncbi:BgTH12-02488 [Blumeria graminis f. sp. triticale]|uniref:BgTH12-02488 n=1 Tax=Blumeria graminis f. sp. triticale TaxID=1689686 RepID=A0A9W4D160_BLUGR|nr:BgTH12-02488 [Blumeria graminis f. sp. triticale]